jgi:hypothetical protein
VAQFSVGGNTHRLNHHRTGHYVGLWQLADDASQQRRQKAF